MLDTLTRRALTPRHRLSQPLSSHLRELNGQFHELQIAGSGMTQEDIEILRGKLRTLTHRAELMEKGEEVPAVNASAASAFRLLDQAEATIQAARRRVVERLQMEELDPDSAIRAQLADGIALVIHAQDLIGGDRRGRAS